MTFLSSSKPVEPWDGFLQEPANIAEDHWLDVFADKSILVTGAGGYIGSALARSLASLPVGRLLLLDTAEHGLYVLDQRLRANPSAPEYSMLVGSVSDETFVQEVFERFGPQIVLHAAALKHVQLMETNPFAAVETNAIGTRRMAQAAERHQVERLILISTDKAVDPISIMGASKRLAELAVLSCQTSTKMTAVRLCNVLGSTGSVAPLFQQQISQGIPVTVTDREATRYFLSLERTVSCLLSGAAAEQCCLFVPRTGAAYSIDQLARFLIAKSLTTDIAVRFTGLRTGDKLHEQMTSSRERLSAESTDDLLTAVESNLIDAKQMDEGFDELLRALSSRDLPRLLEIVQRLVPEYLASDRLLNMSSSCNIEAR